MKAGSAADASPPLSGAFTGILAYAVFYPSLYIVSFWLLLRNFTIAKPCNVCQKIF
jgi:hypothetical protein